MADSRVTLEVVLEGKNLKVVQKDLDKVTSSTNKASAATENLGNKANRYNKGQKGVAGATANSTKAFSKMRSEIGGGSSGLVAAYATLAANLFAATAAFNALRAASKVDELINSLETIGVKSGRNLSLLADGLREITNEAISTEQALRTAAIATSANFSDEQLKNLTRVAKGASLALGRDLGDSLDRLVRGTAKLEPEILDELGIFVRLDDATRDYARTLGKTSEELTDFERRQAFLNSAIAKGEKRFGELADSLDTNPYDKLGAAFKNLGKEIVTSVNGSIIPAVEFLSGNLTALAGVSLVAGSGVAKNVVGSFVQGAEGAANFAGKLSEQKKELLDNLETTERLPGVYKEVSKKIKDGTASLGDYDTAFKSLKRSTESHQTQLNSMIAKTASFNFTVQEKRQRIKDVQNTLKNLRTELIVSTAAQANFTKAQALGAIQAGNYIAGIQFAWKSIKEYTIGVNAATAGSNLLTLSLGKLRIAFFSLGVAIQTSFALVLSFVSIIGVLIALGPQIKDWVENTFFPERVLSKRVNKIAESLDIITESSKDFSKDFFSGQVKASEAAKKASGLIQESISAVQKAAELDKEQQKIRAEQIIEANSKIAESQEKLSNLNVRYANPGAERMINEELKERQDILAKLQAENADGAIVNKQAIKVAQTAVDKFYESIDAQGQLNLLPESSIDDISDAIGLLEKGGEGALDNFIKVLSDIKQPFDKVTSGFESLNGKINDFRDAQNELLKKTATPYDAILEKAKGIKTEVEGITTNTEQLVEATGDLAISKEVLDKLKEAGFESKNQLDSYITRLKDGINLYIKYPGIIKKQEAVVKSLSKFAKQDVAILKEKLTQEAILNGQKLAALQNEEMLINESISTGEKGEQQAARLVEIAQERALLEEKALNILDDEQEIAVARIQQEQKLFEMSKKVTAEVVKQAKARMEIRSIEREIQRLESGAGEFSAQAKLGIFLNEKKERQELLAIEFEQKVQGITLEYDLLEAKYELLKAEAKANGKELTNTQAIEDLMARGRTAALQNAVAQFDLSVKKLDLEEAQLSRAAKDARTAFSSSLQGPGSPAALLQTIKEAQSTYDKTIENLPAIGTKREDGTFVTKEDNDSATARAKLQQVQETMAPFMEQLKALGPEGMLVSAIVQSSLVIADSFQTIGESGLNSAEGLAAVGAVISSVAQIASAAGQQKIAAIDQEIAAEKRRDGKSKESLAKIQALEAKKEKEKRKQFETNKKLMMAQTVVNTAAAVMATLAKDGWWAIPLAALIGAMGAAQLAIIAGTSYQGGGSSGSSNVPSTPTVEVGQRRSSVDLATSQGAAGELAYFRGAKGTGGPENFTPAFMGAKYRNEGGPTAGYTVGEQGPELFVPSVPGTIVPNDEIQQTPQNVNISINAIDSQGVEQVLVEQRGNIIGMIRDAANNIGEDFYEEIETAVYTPSSAGARLY